MDLKQPLQVQVLNLQHTQQNQLGSAQCFVNSGNHFKWDLPAVEKVLFEIFWIILFQRNHLIAKKQKISKQQMNLIDLPLGYFSLLQSELKKIVDKPISSDQIWLLLNTICIAISKSLNGKVF